MNEKKTFVATAPDGSELTRKSSHEYRFSVLVGPSEGRPRWGAWCFSSRRELALKQLAKARAAWMDQADVVLVPAVEKNEGTNELERLLAYAVARHDDEAVRWLDELVERSLELYERWGKSDLPRGGAVADRMRCLGDFLRPTGDGLHVEVELMNDDGRKVHVKSWGETVDDAVALAEKLVRRDEQDDSYVMNETRPA